jgi:hypothetical protein
VPLGAVFFIVFKKGKLTCLGKYDPVGVLERIKWVSTLAAASYFLIDMLFLNGYVSKLWELAENNPGSAYKYHAVCAVLTVSMRILLSISQGCIWMRHSHWKDTTSIRKIYNEKGHLRYIDENTDIGITVFFAKRSFYPLVSWGFWGKFIKCPCFKKIFDFRAEVDPVEAISTGMMFTAQTVIRIEGDNINLCEYGKKMEMLYEASSYGILLLLIWFCVLGVFLMLSAILIVSTVCCCTKDKYEAEFIR